MTGICLYDVFLHQTAEPEKSMCVTLGSDPNSEFYRGANFFENVKFDEKTCFSTVKHKFMIGIGLFYRFPASDGGARQIHVRNVGLKSKHRVLPRCKLFLKRQI